jgi:3-hexulose-6-phosphate synthase/6-phospho-3-hexuloisomerase
MVTLQIALDFTELERALQIAHEVEDYVDWLEAGTPLIKSNGMFALKELRREFPNKTIVADLKTIDTGDIETEIAAKSGANIITVLANSCNSTIKNCVETARNYGCRVMADLISVTDVEKRSKELEKLGVDIIIVHTAIDAQMLGKNPFDNLAKVVKNVNIPVAICGGITPEIVNLGLKNGAEIIIVGNAITKSADAKASAKKFREILTKRTTVTKKTISVEQILAKVSTANLSDAMHRSGEMHDIKAITTADKIVGEAYTVRCYPGDWSKSVQSIDKAKKGNLIVIDAHSSKRAVWGALASKSAKLKGIKAVIIDGAVRDIEEIKEIGLPVFARYVTPTAGEPKGLGELDVPIRCGGILVNPGDYIVIDSDGIVVVPKKNVIEIANRALYIKEKEGRIAEEIAKGKTLGQISNLRRWDRFIDLQSNQ